MRQARSEAPTKNGLAALAPAHEQRSDSSVSLLERGGSTFSVESDHLPERRRSFQVLFPNRHVCCR